MWDVTSFDPLQKTLKLSPRSLEATLLQGIKPKELLKDTYDVVFDRHLTEEINHENFERREKLRKSKVLACISERERIIKHQERKERAKCFTSPKKNVKKLETTTSGGSQKIKQLQRKKKKEFEIMLKNMFGAKNDAKNEREREKRNEELVKRRKGEILETQRKQELEKEERKKGLEMKQKEKQKLQKKLLKEFERKQRRLILEREREAEQQRLLAAERNRKIQEKRMARKAQREEKERHEQKEEEERKKAAAEKEKLRHEFLEKQKKEKRAENERVRLEKEAKISKLQNQTRKKELRRIRRLNLKQEQLFRKQQELKKRKQLQKEEKREEEKKKDEHRRAKLAKSQRAYEQKQQQIEQHMEEKAESVRRFKDQEKGKRRLKHERSLIRQKEKEGALKRKQRKQDFKTRRAEEKVRKWRNRVKELEEEKKCFFTAKIEIARKTDRSKKQIQAAMTKLQKNPKLTTLTPEMLNSMSMLELFDFAGVELNGELKEMLGGDINADEQKAKKPKRIGYNISRKKQAKRTNSSLGVQHIEKDQSPQLKEDLEKLRAIRKKLKIELNSIIEAELKKEDERELILKKIPEDVDRVRLERIFGIERAATSQEIRKLRSSNQKEINLVFKAWKIPKKFYSEFRL